MDRDTRDMLLETADRFFTERCGRDMVNGVEHGAWPADLWKEIEEMGLPLIAVPEDKGGVGGTLGDMLALCGWPARMPCRCRSPRPRSPTSWWRRPTASPGRGRHPRAGQPRSSGGRLSGKVERVPFASVADRFVDDGRRPLAVVAKGATPGSRRAQPRRRALRHGDVRKCRT